MRSGLAAIFKEPYVEDAPRAGGLRPLTSTMAKPLFDTEFNDLMEALGPFEASPLVAIAVSGGPDSLALLILTSRWAASRGGRAVGLIVDHGLRATSAAEAEQTGRWLNRYGVDHHILTWTGSKPTTGLQRHARNARYDLLFAWCRDAGILHLLTGHHQQDQAETVALRRARQSGKKGLSGMAAIREVQGLRLLRPLLGTDKARLKATLDHFGQNWIDDPSNRRLCFTRNRLRHDGFDLAGLTQDASRHGRERSSADKALHTALAKTVNLDPAGFATASAGCFNALSPGLAEDLVANVLMTIGGGVYPPRRPSLRRLVNAMRDDRSFSDQTLGHCRIIKQNQHWLICRERTDASTEPLIPGQWRCWDERFLLRSRHQQRGLLVRALDDRGWSKRHDLVERHQAGVIPHAVRPSLPSVWRDETLLAIPHAGLFDRSFNPLELDLRFRPLTPLGNAPFAAHMCAYMNEKTVAVVHC